MILIIRQSLALAIWRSSRAAVFRQPAHAVVPLEDLPEFGVPTNTRLTTSHSSGRFQFHPLGFILQTAREGRDKVSRERVHQLIAALNEVYSVGEALHLARPQEHIAFADCLRTLCFEFLGQERKSDAAEVHHLLAERTRCRKSTGTIILGHPGGAALQVLVQAYGQTWVCQDRSHRHLCMRENRCCNCIWNAVCGFNPKQPTNTSTRTLRNIELIISNFTVQDSRHSSTTETITQEGRLRRA